jgi:hypothetical protein
VNVSLGYPPSAGALCSKPPTGGSSVVVKLSSPREALGKKGSLVRRHSISGRTRQMIDIYLFLGIVEPTTHLYVRIGTYPHSHYYLYVCIGTTPHCSNIQRLPISICTYQKRHLCCAKEGKEGMGVTFLSLTSPLPQFPPPHFLLVPTHIWITSLLCKVN